MKNRNLIILNCVLDAAQALGIAADNGNDFIKGHAVKGLHAALIAAEEIRQAMVEAMAEKKARIEAASDGEESDA